MSRRYWYLWNGTGSDQVSGSYIQPGSVIVSCIENDCNGGTFTCAVYVPAGFVNPTPNAISVNIRAYLAVAKASHLPLYPQTCTPYVGSRS